MTSLTQNGNGLIITCSTKNILSRLYPYSLHLAAGICFVLEWNENFLSEEGHRVKKTLFRGDSTLDLGVRPLKPVVNGDLLLLPKLETTLTQARESLNCSHFLQVWNGHQSMLFHQLSVGSQFWLQEQDGGPERWGSKHTGREVSLIKRNIGESPRTWEWIMD